MKKDIVCWLYLFQLNAKHMRYAPLMLFNIVLLSEKEKEENPN
jgi:hypothetical protein